MRCRGSEKGRLGGDVSAITRRGAVMAEQPRRELLAVERHEEERAVLEDAVGVVAVQVELDLDLDLDVQEAALSGDA